MSENELFLYDVRLQERFLADGTLESAAHKKHLDSLPDLADQCEEFDLEQPALAKEQVEPPPAPVLAEATPPGVVAPVPLVQPLASPPGAYPAAQPAAPVAPAPAASTFGAPAPTPPQAAPPAPAPAAPAPSAAPDHGPASIPPPTASVDADWGDS